MDVTIGILFCEGVSSAQSMGLGGGFLMTIYDRKNKTAHVLNARETAPAAATRDMFGNNTDNGSVKSESPLTENIRASGGRRKGSGISL